MMKINYLFSLCKHDIFYSLYRDRTALYHEFTKLGTSIRTYFESFFYLAHGKSADINRCERNEMGENESSFQIYSYNNSTVNHPIPQGVMIFTNSQQVLSLTTQSVEVSYGF